MVDKKTVEKWHLKYSHGPAAEAVKDLVWTHSLIVRDIGIQIALNLKNRYGIKADLDLLEIGAMVHDIGVYRCFDDDFIKIEKYVKHGIFGYEILKSEGAEEKIARFAKVHVGVGLTVEAISKRSLPLPQEDLIPISLEEEIITFADKFHSKTKPKFVEVGEQIEDMKKYSDEDVFMFERMIKKFGIPDLGETKLRYNSWHLKMSDIMSQLYAKQNKY